MEDTNVIESLNPRVVVQWQGESLNPTKDNREMGLSDLGWGWIV